MGLRVGLGVSVGSSGLVGSSAGTTCLHTTGSQPKSKAKATAPHGSPKENAHCLLVQQSVPVQFQCDGLGSKRPSRGPCGPVTVRLSNLPRNMRADDVQAMLAPWSEALVGLSDAGADAESRAFVAEVRVPQCHAQEGVGVDWAHRIGLLSRQTEHFSHLLHTRWLCCHAA